MFRSIITDEKRATNPRRVFRSLLILMVISVILYVVILYIMLRTNIIDSAVSKSWTRPDGWIHLVTQLMFPVLLGVLVSFLERIAQICSKQAYHVSVKAMLLNGCGRLASAVLLAIGTTYSLFRLASDPGWLTIDIQPALSVFFPATAFLLGLYSNVGLQLPVVLRGTQRVEEQTVCRRAFRFLLVIVLSILVVIVVREIAISGTKLGLT